MHLGDHHFHKRRAGSYPKLWIDKVIYVFGIAGPVLTIPQVYKIWAFKQAGGVSAFSWGALAVSSVFWLIYGITHKDKPIIFTYSLWVVVNLAVMVGAVVYG